MNAKLSNTTPSTSEPTNTNSLDELANIPASKLQILGDKLTTEELEAIQEYTDKRVAEARAELEAKTDSLYSELENYTPPSTFNSSDANFNEGFYKGELKAMELVCVRLFNKDGDQLRRN